MTHPSGTWHSSEARPASAGTVSDPNGVPPAQAARNGEPVPAARNSEPHSDLDLEGQALPEPTAGEAEPAVTDTEPAVTEAAEPDIAQELQPGAAPGDTDEDEPHRGVFTAPGDRHHDVVHQPEAVEVLPAIARVAADMWLRAAIWGLGTSLRTGARLARAATDPEAALDLYQDVAGGLRAYAREFLGIQDLESQVRQLTPLAGATIPQNGARPEIALREQGAELLRQAADVSFEEGAHPAFARILTELAPDEARILRLLATEGPQPMVDIRAANLIGVGSQLIAPALNMIGAQAGLRRRDRVPTYLNNLLRLGLISFSDDPLENPIAYQVLEAQPDVLRTIKETARAKSVHRSIRMTPLGGEFCDVCLPLEPEGLPPGDRPPPQLPRGSTGRGRS